MHVSHLLHFYLCLQFQSQNKHCQEQVNFVSDRDTSGRGVGWHGDDSQW
jgi:hypothetical protein